MGVTEQVRQPYEQGILSSVQELTQSELLAHHLGLLSSDATLYITKVLGINPDQLKASIGGNDDFHIENNSKTRRFLHLAFAVIDDENSYPYLNISTHLSKRSKRLITICYTYQGLQDKAVFVPTVVWINPVKGEETRELDYGSFRRNTGRMYVDFSQEQDELVLNAGDYPYMIASCPDYQDLPGLMLLEGKKDGRYCIRDFVFPFLPRIDFYPQKDS